MAGNISVNEYLLKEMQLMNSSLSELKYDRDRNVISFHGNEVELGEFKLSEIYDQYSQLKADIEFMTPEDLYNTISINAAVKARAKTSALDNEESIEQIQQIEPSISNIKLINKKDELGTERQYIYITTSDGVSHILYDYLPKDILEAYKRLAQKNGNSFKGITENDLYSELRRSMDDLYLIDSKDAQTKDNLNPDFQNKMQVMERNASQYGNNDGTRVLGNAEHDIYIERGEVVTFNTDSKGNIVRENHVGGNINDSNTVNNDESENKIQDDEIINVDVSKLIDVPEYIKLIESPNELTVSELDKKDFFEGFMADLHTYKSYLGPDALAMWNQYEQFIIISSTMDNPTDKLQDAIDFYNKLAENSKQVELKNAEHKALVLNYQAEMARKNARVENRAGVASAILIVEVTGIVSFMIGAIIYMLTR